MKKILLFLFFAFRLILFGQFIENDSTFNTVDTGFGRGDGANSTIRTTVCQPDGKILIGGSFTSYNGVPINRIARLLPNGQLDTTFNVGLGASSEVNCMAIQSDGKIVIAGNFYTFNGLTSQHIVRLNTNGSVDVSFNPGIIANGGIEDIVIRPNGKIIIAGYFALPVTFTSVRLAQLNTDGTVDLTFASGFWADNPVICLKLQPDGKLLIGGIFMMIYTTNRNRVARLNLNGTLDTSFDPGLGANGSVFSIDLQTNGSVLLAGAFTSFNGTTINHLVRLTASGSIDNSFTHNLQSVTNTNFWWFSRQSVSLQPNGKILIGGSITVPGNSNQGNIFRLNSNGQIDNTFLIGTSFKGRLISKLTLQADGKILFAGAFHDFNDTLVNSLGRLNTNGTIDYFNLPGGTGANVGSWGSGWASGWASGPSFSNRIINSIATQPDGKILIGGTMGYFNGVSKNCIARLNPSGSLDASFNCKINGVSVVNSIVVQPDGKILVGGNFLSVNGVPCTHLVRLNTNGTLDASFQTSSIQIVGSISLQPDGKIIVGQSFGANNILVRLNANGTMDNSFTTSSIVNTMGSINDIEIQPNGKIIVVGYIQLSTSNFYYPNIARLNTNGSLDTTFNPGLGTDNEISELLLQPDGKMVILGSFSTVNGISREYMARLNSNGTLDTTFNSPFGTTYNWNPIQCAVLQSNGKILIGGENYSWNNSPLNNFYRINTNGTFDTTFVTGSGFNSYVYAIAIQTDGKILVGGDFTSYNGIGRNRIARIITELPDASVSLNSLSGQDICANRALSISFTVKNSIAEGPLPIGTPVSFFANASTFLATVFTTDTISTGDSLTMAAVISIPMAVSSPFNLSIIANQDSINLGVMGELNLTNNVSNDTLISLNEIFIPTFDSIAPVCQGTNVVLPTTSTNGVAGTWSPAFNNQVTTTYLFIPAETNCVDSVQLTVQIVPTTLPTFSLADSICANGTLVFPTVSSNTFTGMWSAAFDNQNSATYTFTPDSLNVPASACPITTQHAVVIVPQTIPSFSFVDSLCIGASFVLPSQANNGILGTWSAPFNNQMTTSYSFSPSTVSIFNGCAVPVSQTITIIPTLSPTFSFADSMCADIVFDLPISSNENVLGTWSTVFNNQATQNYTFTPNYFGIVNTNLGFRCPLSASKTITIVPRTSPIFTILDSICVGASLILPSTSDNLILGTWSPVINNQVTTAYTFAPTSITVATGCPQTAQKTVVVDPFVNPIFTSIDSICQGNSVSLSTLSENFINGNWSPIFNNQATTNYIFTPSDPGCITTAQMTVPVFPLITPSFSITDSICQNDTLVFPTVSDNSISGTWSPAFNSQQTTTYTFTPNVYECAVSVQWTVQVAPRILPTFSLPDTICQSEIIVLPLISDNGISGTWSPIFNNQQTTNYTFIRNANECASNTSANITVMPTSITFDTIIYCENDLPFNWFGQILTSSTNTSVTLQDQYGCDSVVKLYFQVLPIQYSSFSATICSNDPAFQWAGQSYNQTGSYNQTFTAQNGCDSVVTFNLLVNPSPNVDFSVVNWSGCLPAEISFVNNQVAPNTTYLWDFGNGKVGSGSNGESSLYTQAGCFDVQLTATNEFGCVEIQNQQNAVCFDPNPVASFSPQNNPLPLVNPVTLFDNNSTSANTWLWDFGDGNQNTSLFSPLHTFPEKAGIYYVTLYIENENGCKDSTVQKIIVEQDPLFYVPNAFTPDNNEFNEVFLPVFSDNLVLSDFELRITNRWGELLFVSQNPTVGWNGTYGGKLVQDGVYVYNLVFREVGFASVFQSTGSVNLIR